MKLKSLILGSVAATGLSTGAFAADLNVLSSLDVCDLLGVSGLTISSDTNCLSITGGVEYDFAWGNYYSFPIAMVTPGGWAPVTSNIGIDGFTHTESTVEAWLQFVGAGDSDAGTASATIKLKGKSVGGVYGGYGPGYSPSTAWVYVDKAFVQVGDTTVLTAGLASSIFNDGDDDPLNYLGLFVSEGVDNATPGPTGGGVSADPFGLLDTGGHVIQVSHAVDSMTFSAGLEGLGSDGTAVGTVEYAGDGISAHVSVVADDIFISSVSGYALHAGITAEVDNFTLVAALGATDINFFSPGTYWNALASAEVALDGFTVAASVEATSEDELGVGASIGADVTDDIGVEVGFRYLDEVFGFEVLEVGGELTAALSETLTGTATVGYVDQGFFGETELYGGAGLDWTPSDDLEVNADVMVYSWSFGDTGYKLSFGAEKTFE